MSGPQVQLTLEGEGSVPARVGQTVLEAALDGGLALPFGCQSAKCGVCLVEGGEGLQEPEALEGLTLRTYGCPSGQRLACQARLAADAVVRRATPDR